MNEIQKRLMAQYNGVYHATKEWDDELYLIKLKLVNDNFKAIYAEQLCEN